MGYLPAFPLECGHCSPGVGKYTIHGTYWAREMRELQSPPFEILVGQPTHRSQTQGPKTEQWDGTLLMKQWRRFLCFFWTLSFKRNIEVFSRGVRYVMLCKYIYIPGTSLSSILGLGHFISTVLAPLQSTLRSSGGCPSEAAVKTRKDWGDLDVGFLFKGKVGPFFWGMMVYSNET